MLAGDSVTDVTETHLLQNVDKFVELVAKFADRFCWKGERVFVSCNVNADCDTLKAWWKQLRLQELTVRRRGSVSCAVQKFPLFRSY